MNGIVNAISRLVTVARRWVKKGREEEDVVYRCSVAQEPAGWLVIEIQWSDLLHFLKKRPKFNSLPDDIVKAHLDFSRITVHPDMVRYNPSVRIRKGTRSEVVPITLAGPVEGQVYFLSVRKLTLAHIERQFRFNFATWPPANFLPLLVGGGLFALWGIYDGWQLHRSDEFFAAVAVVGSLTTLAFALWRLIVYESDKRHDALCRRLEHELMAQNMAQVSTAVNQVLKFLQDYSRTSTGQPPDS